MYSGKSPISFEVHLDGLEEQTKAILLHIRKFVMSLGENVIEEVRPHRIVYAKSLTFRYFLDIQPRKDLLVILIRKSRRQEQSVEHIVKSMQDLDGIRSEIAQAYESI
jgi:hypothetical protein